MEHITENLEKLKLERWAKALALESNLQKEMMANPATIAFGWFARNALV